MKLSFSVIIITLLLTVSCKSNRFHSLAVVGSSYDDVRYIFTKGDSISPNPDIKMFEKKDSLVVLSYMNSMPFEAVFLFENDTCNFQRLKIYCSPCADKVVENIVNDKDYKFEVLDPVNYVSRTDEKIVMRLKEQRDQVGDCNEISIYKLSDN